MSITTYLPTRVHTDATGRAVSNGAGRLVRGWAKRTLCNIYSTKRFRIVDYTDGDIEQPGAPTCWETGGDPVWDGTFPYYAGFNAWCSGSGGIGGPFFSVNGKRCRQNYLKLEVLEESSVTTWLGWPAAIPALTPGIDAAAKLVRLWCGVSSVYALWGGFIPQRQIVDGVDLWCSTLAGTYIRGDKFTNDPAQLEIEEY
jgi:hypothetical protein